MRPINVILDDLRAARQRRDAAPAHSEERIVFSARVSAIEGEYDQAMAAIEQAAEQLAGGGS